jgi:hypothetical protein
MKAIIKIKLILLLFSIAAISLYGQGGDGGDSGGGEKKIWEPDLVELWIYWHKTQFRMFTEFAANEDTLQSKQYEDYMYYMKKLAEVDAVLFSQYQNNSVPLPNFMFEYGQVILLAEEIESDFGKFRDFINEPPVVQELKEMYDDSETELRLKYIKLLSSTTKALTPNQANNLRDNRLRDDLINNIMKEMFSVKYSLNSLFLRMTAAKQNARQE